MNQVIYNAAYDSITKMVQKAFDQVTKEVTELKKIPSNEVDLYYNMAILDVLSIISQIKQRIK